MNNPKNIFPVVVVGLLFLITAFSMPSKQWNANPTITFLNTANGKPVVLNDRYGLHKKQPLFCGSAAIIIKRYSLTTGSV